jgi:hypothetical protein
LSDAERRRNADNEARKGSKAPNQSPLYKDFMDSSETQVSAGAGADGDDATSGEVYVTATMQRGLLLMTSWLEEFVEKSQSHPPPPLFQYDPAYPRQFQKRLSSFIFDGWRG